MDAGRGHHRNGGHHQRHVAPLHAASVRADLAAAGLEAHVYTIPAGEASKTWQTVLPLYGRLLADGFDRTSTVLALGGGVVGDLAGFVAATYMRGIAFVQVPTSLLAMVDASVGGKVGVDHPQAKNLIGAFKQPALVVADTRFLRTLPARERRCGLAEVVKHGLIGAPHILTWLESGRWSWPALIREAIAVKKAVVEDDPFERGRRAVLNLGHTFAHALEVVSNYTLPHGEAVAVGLVLAARLAVRVGLADEPLAARVEALLHTLGLPVRLSADPAAVWQAMQGDKKKARGRLRFVLPRAVGDVIVTDAVPPEVVRTVLAEILCPERPPPEA
ncbi:MAG: 3-dehydroquinate synthase [Ardenticatenia bacterium]|nr:3-dehydroquinate synthase [Ardenticatenia bacterium]